MGYNSYCAFTVLSLPRRRTYGNTQNHRKSSFSSVRGSQNRTVRKNVRYSTLTGIAERRRRYIHIVVNNLTLEIR